MNETNSLQVACPQCGKRLRVKAALDGKRVKCPACSHSIPVNAHADDGKVGEPEAAKELEVPRPRPANRPSAFPWITVFCGVGATALLVLFAFLWLGAKSAMRTVKDELTASEERLAELAGAKTDATKRLAGAEQRIQELNSQIASVEQKLAPFQKTLKDKDAIIERLSKELAAAKQDAQAAKEKVDGLMTELADAKKAASVLPKKKDKTVVEKPKEVGKLDSRLLIGKWLMRDGVIEFKEGGVFVNLGEKHAWEVDGSDLVLIFKGRRQPTPTTVSGDKLTQVIGGEKLVSTRLDSKKYGSTSGKWQTKDLAGDWSAGDSITLKLDSQGKGTCTSKFQVGNTNIANFEFALVEVFRLDDIHALRIQKMNWIIRPTDDRKSLELIAADDNAINPGRAILKRK